MNLTNEQQKQEEEYILPYHYLDLTSDIFRFTYNKYLHAIDIVKNHLKPFNGQTILDAGCGDGRLCYEMRNEKVSMIGVDFSKRAIDFARIINPQAKFYVGSVIELTLDSQVDQIVSMEVIEHIQPELLPSVLKQYHDVLKTNGTLIITVPSNNVPVAEKHYQHFSPDSIRETIGNYFDIIHLQGCFDCRSFNSNVYTFLTEFELMMLPFRKSSYKLSRYLSRISRFYSKVVTRYFLKNIKYCSIRNASSLIIVSRKK